MEIEWRSSYLLNYRIRILSSHKEDRPRSEEKVNITYNLVKSGMDEHKWTLNHELLRCSTRHSLQIKLEDDFWVIKMRISTYMECGSG